MCVDRCICAGGLDHSKIGVVAVVDSTMILDLCGRRLFVVLLVGLLWRICCVDLKTTEAGDSCLIELCVESFQSVSCLLHALHVPLACALHPFVSTESPCYCELSAHHAAMAAVRHIHFYTHHLPLSLTRALSIEIVM